MKIQYSPQSLSRALFSLISTGCWLSSGIVFAVNLAPEGKPILGIKEAIDDEGGESFEHGGVIGSINDELPHSTRVDNWAAADSRGVSFVGTLWEAPREEAITHLELTMALFGDGGWFGPNGMSPAAGTALTLAHLIEPTIQVSDDSGDSWRTISHTSNYLSQFEFHNIGGGINGNPTVRTATFLLDNPVTGINGIRIIGENGGLAGPDTNGFIGVFEFEVHTGPIPVRISDTGTAIIGVNDAIDGDAGTARANAGIPANINDGALHTRVDTWFGGNSDLTSFVGILWDEPQTGCISSLELTMGTFFDGGWFGVNGVSPPAGGALDAATHLLTPTIQVTSDGGTSWVNVPASSDYLSIVDGHRIGGNGIPNPSRAIVTFNIHVPVSGIDGIRIIGQNGGFAGSDTNGFLGVLELEVYSISLPHNIGQDGTAIMGVNNAIDGDNGTAYTHSGIAGHINDGCPISRVDTWFAGNANQVSYVGILWDDTPDETITGLDLTMATFFDGGWFGRSGLAPTAGENLDIIAHLVEPKVQITVTGGITWHTISATSNYLTAVHGHGIGGGGNPNPSTATARFTLNTPVSGINGIRIIGENGGSGSDTNGFLGVFELEVSVATEIPVAQVLYHPAPSDSIELTWDSEPDRNYAIFYSTDLTDFSNSIPDAIPSDGASTNYLFTNPVAGAPRLFFRVVETP